jgi:SOS-response transcriptional repressor LexA
MNTMHVPVLDGVECGKPVPDDWNKWLNNELREISEIRDKVPFAKYIAVPVRGHSLKGSGIHDGDILICRKTHSYVPGSIGIWETPHGRTAKYAAIDKDGFVLLHNHNGWKQKWSSDEVKLVAVAVRVERDLE